MDGGLSNVSYAVGPGLRFPDEYGFPRFDELPQNERLNPDSPLIAGTIRGQPIILAQRDPRYGQTGGRTITQPISISRLRRAIDIERGYDTGPFVPSAIDDFPIAYMPAWPLTGTDEHMDPISVGLAVLLGATVGAGLWLLGDTYGVFA